MGRVRVRLLERLVPLSPAALVGVRGGELLATLRSDVDELQAAFIRLAQPAAVALVSGTVAVGLTALVSPALAVVLTLLLVLLGAVVPAWTTRAGRGPSTVAQDAEAAVGADVLDLAFDEIREYGADALQVSRRMRAVLQDLRATTAPPRHAELDAHLARLDSAVMRAFPEGSPGRDTALVADRTGLGLARR